MRSDWFTWTNGRTRRPVPVSSIRRWYLAVLRNEGRYGVPAKGTLDAPRAPLPLQACPAMPCAGCSCDVCTKIALPFFGPLIRPRLIPVPRHFFQQAAEGKRKRERAELQRNTSEDETSYACLSACAYLFPVSSALSLSLFFFYPPSKPPGLRCRRSFHLSLRIHTHSHTPRDSARPCLLFFSPSVFPIL